ncbi:MAG TPA: NUDIX domain-containing protein [Chloroflexota bacterium]|jgi:ADP-ribose pyrophosphatase YjhB (NUDIX family)|nr:NUDIX domain-containing protein [Chloroflexota bacterium]
MGYVEDLRLVVGHRPLILVAGVALIFDEQEHLLLIERSDDRQWAVVGGLMEPGETVEETVRREVHEEVGLELGALQLLGVLSGPDAFHVYPNGDQVYGVAVAYAARHPGPEPQPDPSEALQARFFALNALPANLRKTTAFYLKLYAEAAHHG